MHQKHLIERSYILDYKYNMLLIEKQHKGLDQVIDSLEMLWLKSQIIQFSLDFIYSQCLISFGFTQSFLKFIVSYEEVDQKL